MVNASLRPSLAAVINQSMLGITPRLFVSPPPAGRRITAGFSFIHRIGKSSNIDVWFPEALQRELNALIAAGEPLGPQNFPAQWAAVRQFELLQEAGNYKIYDMDVTHLTRTLMDMTRNMRAGGYRVTVASLGSYTASGAHDELEILDKRLQDRISKLIHMLYLEEQSEAINETFDRALAAEKWDFHSALPHIGATLGARDLFRPVQAKTVRKQFPVTIPHNGNAIVIANWLADYGVSDSLHGLSFAGTEKAPRRNQYKVEQGRYSFAAEDAGREIIITCMVAATEAPRQPDAGERRHKLARHFFDVLGLLPHRHIVHDTAVGLQLPEAINENEWIYLAPGDETIGIFNGFLCDLFAPFDGISLSALHERADARPEVKGSSHHMRGYGDRLNAESDAFYRDLANLALG